MPRLSLMGGGLFAQTLVFACVLATLECQGAGAEDAAATDKKEEEKTAMALPPELEDRLTDFLTRASEAKRKIWTTRMKREIERIGKVAEMGEAESKALEGIAEQVSEACIGGWAAKLDESYRQYLFNYENEEVDQMLAQVDQVAQSDWFGNYVRPFNHPKWEEGIQRTLGPDKAAAWKKARSERDEAVKKEAADILKVTVQNSSQQQETMLLAKGAVIKSLLSLPKARGEQFETLAKSVAAEGAGKFRQRAEELLLAMEEPEIKQLLKSRQFYVQEEPKYIEAQRLAWDRAVAGLLSDEEKSRLKVLQDISLTRRGVVMGSIMVTLLDDRIAFTASQRKRLQPIVERLVKSEKSLFDEMGQQGYYRLNAQAFFAAGAKANGEDLEPILDASQLKRWKDVCLKKNYRPNQGMLAGVRGGVLVLRKSEPAAAPKPPTPAPEPEDVENALSDNLHSKTVSQRQQLLALNLLRAEDAARVASLAPAALDRLNTAARGMTEATLAIWKASADQNIRSQLQDATAENIKQRLLSIGTYSYQPNRGSEQSPAPIWDATVKAEMTEPQLAAWKKELDLRTDYREKAIAGLILSEFDRKISVSPEQWAKLEAIITEKVKDYAPDIEAMFSSSYPYTWFLQSYTMFIPFAAVPEADLKAMLSTEQWDNWSGSPEMENTNNYWENVKNRHEQRMKEKKK